MMSSHLDILHAAVTDATEATARLSECLPDLIEIAERAARVLNAGGKLMFCGNGGSAAQAQHIATEFVVRLSADRERRALPAFALTADTVTLTACANDYGFARVFARQVEALGKPGDMLFLLSTSGGSPNLLEAAMCAQSREIHTVAWVGEQRSPLSELTDRALHVPSTSGQRVQEAHLLLGHLLVDRVEAMIRS